MSRQAPRRLAWIDPPLAELPVPAGKMILTRSLTSGLTQRPDDPDGVFWGVGDRGPNMKLAKAAKRYGLTHLARASADDGAKVLPLPQKGPHLARFRLEDERVILEALLPLRTPDGALVPSLPPPALPGMETEPVFGLLGQPLGTAVDGADPEGIAARPDGRFWIAEEYGPSLLLVTEDGVVERRVVPHGCGKSFAGAAIPTEARLPRIALFRKLNRGFETLATSPDGSTLYTAFQSPLAHPDRAAHDDGKLVRLWALDPESCELQAEYAYPLGTPAGFARDRAEGSVAKNDIKVSELAALPDGSLLVLERVTLSTHIYRVTPRPELALPAHFSEPQHRQTLEQHSIADAKTAGLPLLDKQLVFSADDHPDISGDLEGMLVLTDGSLLLANDSDYGIEGAETQFWQVTLPAALQR